MALIGYFKAEPTEFVLAFANGRIVRQGAGSSFWYWQPTTSIALVPVSTTDLPFVLNEKTATFQAVAVQGQLTYRIVDPAAVAGLLNFTIFPRSRKYRSDDPEKLGQRLINIVQAHIRAEIQRLTLEEALLGADGLGETITQRVRAETGLAALGVECVGLHIISVKPTPEMAKALEAEHREALQMRADQALYARRAEAVEQERKIKQNELSTQTNLEQQRQALVDLEGENARRVAAFEAEALRTRLAPYQELDPRLVLALAFRDFAANADKIGNLHISSEILERLLNDRSAA